MWCKLKICYTQSYSIFVQIFAYFFILYLIRHCIFVSLWLLSILCVVIRSIDNCKMSATISLYMSAILTYTILLFYIRRWTMCYRSFTRLSVKNMPNIYPCDQNCSYWRPLENSPFICLYRMDLKCFEWHTVNLISWSQGHKLDAAKWLTSTVLAPVLKQIFHTAKQPKMGLQSTIIWHKC